MPESIFKRMGGAISVKIDAMNTALQASIDSAKVELEGSIDAKVATATTSQYHNTPYDIASAVVNKPSGNAKVLKFAAVRLFSVSTNLVGSYFIAGTPSNGTAIFSIFKNATQIGTITFSSGVANGVISCTASSFQLGDILTITAPTVQDTKLADITFTIVGHL